MTIFLVLVVIVLIIVFNSVRASQIERLEEKIGKFEKLIRDQAKSSVKTEFLEKTETNTNENSINTVIPKPESTETKPLPIDLQKNKDIEPTDIVSSASKTSQNQISQLKPISNPKISVEPELSWYENFRKNNPDLEKFIGENILSKVAIVVLVIGIAFFVKFAIDKNWINEIARVGIGILSGIIVMVFAHRLHQQFKAFSSVLVAGAITIFYFTIGIAFHQYHIFNQTTAFLIMAIITGFSVFVSVVYDRVELAALSLIGGFTTPMMVSTGQGNYLVLFSYILILDLGMLALAYLRKWNLINVLTYVFTMIIYAVWLQTKVINHPNAPYLGTLLFGAVFYIVFVLMNVIHNVKSKQKFGALELSILISNTFLFYGFGMQILSYWHPEFKGMFSACLALFNLICSWLLYKKFKADEKLVYLLIGLTLTFITLIAPVQLDGNYITLFWALESVLLIWLSQKSGIVLFRFASVIIVVLLCFSLIMDWSHIYGLFRENTVPVFLNKAFITGLISTFSVGFTIWLLKKDIQEQYTYLGISMKPKLYAGVLMVLMFIFAYFTGILELGYQLNQINIQTSSITITLFAYHLMFFVLLQRLLVRKNNQHVNLSFIIINYVNVSIYTLVFILFSVYDLKLFLFNPNYTMLGFWMHYILIVCAIASIYNIYKQAISATNPFTITSLRINTVLLSFFIVFLVSTESVLHGLKFNVSQIINDVNDAYFSKIKEYYSVRSHIIKIIFPILWGIIAFLFLAIGMKKNYQILRIMSLVLIAITLLKLFTFDIKDASEAGKIIAFILLGIVLLIISFMYQKIKAFIVNDHLNKKED